MLIACMGKDPYGDLVAACTLVSRSTLVHVFLLVMCMQ